MKYKIIIAGPVGAGKTTAINSLTNNNALMTDAPVSDEVTRKRKLNTTVAMDFGVVKINADDVAYVYGTPGQQRFSFMWEILSEGAHGLIILLDNTRNYPFRDLKYYVENFADLIQSKGMILGVTRSDEGEEATLEMYQKWLKDLKVDSKVTFIDARKREDVERLVHQLVDKVNNDKAELTQQIKNHSEDQIVNSEVADAQAENEVQSVIEVTQIEEVAETPVTTELIELAETTDDKIDLDEKALQDVAAINGVDGVSLTNSVGELLHSTIDDAEINEFIAFLSGITPALEDACGMGRIHRIMLRGPKDDNLTVFVEQEKSLGVSSDKCVSVPALSQKIEDMLQWA